MSGIRRFVASAIISCALVSAAAAQEPIEPDRPDITNTPHLVGVGIFQLEMGGIYTQADANASGMASPVGLRVGVRRWLEARVSVDGWLRASDSEDSATGFGNVQLGAKIRLWPDQDGGSFLSAAPLINLPVANAEKGLGSGRTDFYIATLTGVDIGRSARLDVNYAIGAIGASDSDERFAQHLASASVSVSAGDRWSPYGEVYTISRVAADGTAIVAVDTGALYLVRPNLSLDAGVQFGMTGAAPSFAAFAGLSVGFGTSALGPQAVRTTTTGGRITSASRLRDRD